MGGRSSGGFSKGGGGSALTSGEKDSIFDYTTSRFQSINGALRSGKAMSAGDRKTSAGLDSAIGKSHLAGGQTLYRGSSPEALGINKSVKNMSAADLKGLIGKTITDKAYMSTSTSKKSANIFAGRGDSSGSVIFRIKTTGKRKGLSVGSNSNFGNKESEVILPKNASLKITGVRRSLGKIYVEATY